MSAAAALDVLLSGSGLQARRTANGWVVSAASAPANPIGLPGRAETEQLPTVVVTEAAERARYARAFRPPEVSAGILGPRSQVDVPFSISSFNRELIDLQQAVTPSDVLKNDPSVTSSSTPGDAALYAQIRGFDVGGLINGLESRAHRPNQFNFYLFNIERIDVLKGVSGFLIGGTAAIPIGGTINYITKRPTAVDFSSLTFGYADKARALVHADVSRRFGQDRVFGIRANLATQRGETPIQGTDFSTDMAALALDFKPSSRLNFNAGVEYGNILDKGYRDRYFGIDGSFQVPRAPDPRINHTQRWAFQRNESLFWNGEVNWQFADDWRLTAKALQGETKRPYLSGYGGLVNAAGDLDVFPGFGPNQRIEFRAADIALRGLVRTGPIAHELAFNVNQTHSKFFLATNFAALNSGPLFSNIYSPVFYPNPNFPNSPSSLAVEERGQSIGISDFITFSDRWSALIGVRRQTLEGNSLFDTPYDNTRVSPVLALMYKPIPQATVFAHYAEGLERGRTAPIGTTNAGQTLGPGVTEQIELGMKYETREKLLLTEPPRLLWRLGSVSQASSSDSIRQR
jgi:iron complex outermembrane receptor protein